MGYDMANGMSAITDEDFVFIDATGIKEAEETGYISKRSLWKEFTGNRSCMTGAILLFLLVLMAIFVPELSRYKYDEQNFLDVKMTPCPKHLFGTDILGRDMFARCFMGLRVSVIMAVAATIINLLIGMNYGIISGYFGGKADIIMQRILDVLGSIPTLVVVTLLMIVLKPGMVTIIIALALTGWIEISLIARSQVLKIKNLEYVQAARTLGAGNLHIITKEIIPNTVQHLLPQIMISVPSAVFLEAFLSFVGLGMPVGSCSLGTLLSNGFANVLIYPYLLFPAAVIMLLLMIACHLMATGMEELLN